MSRLKASFHVHTEFSRDSSLKVEKLLELCLRFKIDLLIITDHNNMGGYQKAKKLVQENNIPLLLIPAEEIATSQGEVIGLFLEKEIPKGLSLDQTLLEIKRQKALTCLPHPFDSIRRERIRDKELILKHIDQIDLIEVFNSRNLKSKDNLKALELANQYQKNMIWGSDAHFGYEFSNCFFEIPDFKMDRDLFIEALGSAHKMECKKSIRGFFQSLSRKYLLFPKF